ncbi:hypothetical protein ACFX2J_004187 [Malus domestica]
MDCVIQYWPLRLRFVEALVVKLFHLYIIVAAAPVAGKYCDGLKQNCNSRSKDGKFTQLYQHHRDTEPEAVVGDA